MDTTEIDKKLANVPGFIGAFAYDQLPPNSTNDFSLVLNTDPSHLPGEHWLAIVKNQTLIYFIDSYGRHYTDSSFETPFIKTVEKLIGQNKVVYNKMWLQQLTSNVCGDYCVYFIRELSKNSFKKCLAVFSDDLRKNDKHVLNYVKNI